MEIYFADTRGDTHRDSNKPRSAELYVRGLKPTPSLPRGGVGLQAPSARGEGYELEKSMINLFVKN